MHCRNFVIQGRSIMTARKFALGYCKISVLRYCKISVDHIEDCYTRCFIPSVLNCKPGNPEKLSACIYVHEMVQMWHDWLPRVNVWCVVLCIRLSVNSLGDHHLKASRYWSWLIQYVWLSQKSIWAIQALLK